MSGATDQQLRGNFGRMAYPGPNPFYACKACGASVPGVRNELEDHFLSCPVLHPVTGTEGAAS